MWIKTNRSTPRRAPIISAPHRTLWQIATLGSLCMLGYIALAPPAFVLHHAPQCYRIAHGLGPCCCCGTLRGLLAATQCQFADAWRLNPLAILLPIAILLNAFCYLLAAILWHRR